MMSSVEKILKDISETITKNQEENKDYKIDGMQYIGSRENQEDTIAYLKKKDQVFGCLADGIGGLEFGEIASALSCNTLLKTFLSVGNYDHDFLISGFQEADRRVTSYIKKNKLKGSGCTLIGVFIYKNELRFCSIGDSSIFLYRNGTLERMNRQHNYKLYLDDLLLKKQISDIDYQANLNKKDVVISYIGKNNISLIDFNKEAYALKPDDLILMCSDGILSAVSQEEIQSIIQHNSNPATINTSIINLVKMKKKNKQDNSSIITIYKRKDI